MEIFFFLLFRVYQLISVVWQRDIDSLLNRSSVRRIISAHESVLKKEVTKGGEGILKRAPLWGEHLQVRKSEEFSLCSVHFLELTEMSLARSSHVSLASWGKYSCLFSLSIFVIFLPSIT